MPEHSEQASNAEQQRSPAALQPHRDAPASEAVPQIQPEGWTHRQRQSFTGAAGGTGDPNPAGKGMPAALLQRQQARVLGDARLSGPRYAQRRAELFLQLQQAHGNAHARQVAELLQEQQRQSVPPLQRKALHFNFPSFYDRYTALPQETRVQRCGSTPCDCSPAQQAAHAGEEEAQIQRSAGIGSGEQVDVVGEIGRSRGNGQQLDPAARAKLEPAMGVDLTQVTIHTGSQADTLSRSVQAEAFTTGTDIYFRSGRYDPHSDTGLHLLAHEVTHTVQQSRGTVSGTQHSSGVSVSDPADSFEREAEQNATRTMERLSTRPAFPKAEVAARQAALGEAINVQRVAAVEPPQATSGEQIAGPVVQRGVIETLTEGGVAVANAFKAIAKLAMDPEQLAAVLAEIAWDKLPDAVKGEVIDKLLDVCLVVVKNLPDPGAEVSFLWPMLKNGMIGFVERAKSYPSDWKIKVVTRIIKLKAHPTTNFTLGFLKGFVKGLWDGITGPFVLLWDLIKLEGKIIEMQIKALKGIAHKDTRDQLIQQLRKTWQTVSDKIGQALQEVMSGQSDPSKILHWIGDLLQAAVKKAQSAGASIADSLLKFFDKPDAELGESLGYVEGVIIFEVLLLVLTDGGYTALKEALNGIKWIAEAVETAGRWGSKALAALEPVLSALRTFGAFLRSSSKALGGIMDALEELFNLLIKYFKFSYGLEGGAERAAGKGATKGGEKAAAKSGERAAKVIHGERQVTNEFTHETHEVRLLENGALCRASNECVELVESVHQRVSKLSGKGVPAGELNQEARALEEEAKQLVKESQKIKAEEGAVIESDTLSQQERAAHLEELEKKDDQLLDKVAQLDRKINTLEPKVVLEHLGELHTKTAKQLQGIKNALKDEKIQQLLDKNPDLKREVEAEVARIENELKATHGMVPGKAEELDKVLSEKTEQTFEQLQKDMDALESKLHNKPPVGPSQRTYDPSPKHAEGGWGTPMDLDDATAQKVLQEGITGPNGKQVYGFHNQKLYEFQPDNIGGFHGYPVPGTEVPPEVLRKMRDDGIITSAQYTRFLRGQ